MFFGSQMSLVFLNSRLSAHIVAAIFSLPFFCKISLVFSLLYAGGGVYCS